MDNYITYIYLYIQIILIIYVYYRFRKCQGNYRRNVVYRDNYPFQDKYLL